MNSLSYSQDTLTRQKERLLIEDKDTFVVMSYMRAKVLFEQLAKLSERKRICDSLIIDKDSTIASGKLKQIELEEAIDIRKSVEQDKNEIISSLERTLSITRKKWIKNTLYASAGGAVIGLIVGIIIAK